MLKCPKCNVDLEVRLTAAPPMQADKAKAGQPASSDEVGELLNAIDDGSLDEGSVNFVRETRARFAQYGDRIRMSDKQMNWLKKLAGGNEDDEWQ